MLSAVQAMEAFQGRYIYDGCCQLDIKGAEQSDLSLLKKTSSMQSTPPSISSHIISEMAVKVSTRQNLIHFAHNPSAQLVRTHQATSFLHVEQLLAYSLSRYWDPGGSRYTCWLLSCKHFAGNITVYFMNPRLDLNVWEDENFRVLSTERYVQWDWYYEDSPCHAIGYKKLGSWYFKVCLYRLDLQLSDTSAWTVDVCLVAATKSASASNYKIMSYIPC